MRISLFRASPRAPGAVAQGAHSKRWPRARFDPKDTADDIATVIIGMFSASKAEDVARRTLAKLSKPRKGKKLAEDDQAEKDTQR